MIFFLNTVAYGLKTKPMKSMHRPITFPFFFWNQNLHI